MATPYDCRFDDQTVRRGRWKSLDADALLRRRAVLWTERVSLVSKQTMQYRSKMTNVAAVAILTLACDTPQRNETIALPPVNRPMKGGADPDQPGFNAFAQWDCGPGDGPNALTVYVAIDTVFTFFPPEVPHFRIHIFDAADRNVPAGDSHPALFRPRTELAHRTFQWPADQGDVGTLQLCHDADCKRLTEGRVTFGDVRLNHIVEGAIDVGATANIKTRRHFKANWGPRSKGCG
jgi:hypothetical protein